MENKVGMVKREDPIELPPGFRFHPTDEELITHYLLKKVLHSTFEAIAIGEVDMNKIEPWELPWRAKLGEKEWYFFSVRDKKYPSGHRTNRATASGYWKATGKDKEIFKGKTLVGMKKTLVFYNGRAPKGLKSNWVAHEYRLEGQFSLHKLPKSSMNDWVISRVFQKTSGGKKVQITGLMRRDNCEVLNSSRMPPLMELEDQGHVHCFSSPVTAPQKLRDDDFIPCFSDPIFPPASNPVDSDSLSSFSGLNPFHDSRNMIPNYEPNLNQGFGNEAENSSVVSNIEMEEKSFDEHGALSTSIGIQDFACIWSY